MLPSSKFITEYTSFSGTTPCKRHKLESSRIRKTVGGRFGRPFGRRQSVFRGGREESGRKIRCSAIRTSVVDSTPAKAKGPTRRILVQAQGPARRPRVIPAAEPTSARGKAAAGRRRAKIRARRKAIATCLSPRTLGKRPANTSRCLMKADNKKFGQAPKAKARRLERNPLRDQPRSTSTSHSRTKGRESLLAAFASCWAVIIRRASFDLRAFRRSLRR